MDDYEAEDEALRAELRAKRKPFAPRRPMTRRERDAFFGIPSFNEESATAPNEPSDNMPGTTEHNFEEEAFLASLRVRHRPFVTPDSVVHHQLTASYGSSGNMSGTSKDEISHTKESNSANDLNKTYIICRGQPRAASSSSTNSFNISPDVLDAFNETSPAGTDEHIAEQNDSTAQGPLTRASTSVDLISVAPVDSPQVPWHDPSSDTTVFPYDQVKADIYDPQNEYVPQPDADNYNRGNGTDISQSLSNSPSPPARVVKNARRAKPRATATLDVTSDGNGTDARAKRNNNNNRDTYVLDKPKLIKSDENEEPSGLRRSKRTRVPPLRNYLGERAIYRRDSNGLPVLVGVSTVELSKRNAHKYLIVDQVLEKPKKTRR